ncbi:MAG: AtpZ/AtpI family protein [Nostocaceae cyanobacterium]|nr:AtpZ/AtpI family protein [Nostocaceae cyanobacterium]
MDSDKLPHKNHHKIRLGFIRKVAHKATRKLKAKRQKNQGVWFGLGILGLVGWSIVVPALIGMVLGNWIDRRFPSHVSWTLTLMLGGLILGCMNAWYWVMGEQSQMEKSRRETPQIKSQESNKSTHEQ